MKDILVLLCLEIIVFFVHKPYSYMYGKFEGSVKCRISAYFMIEFGGWSDFPVLVARDIYEDMPYECKIGHKVGITTYERIGRTGRIGELVKFDHRELLLWPNNKRTEYLSSGSWYPPVIRDDVIWQWGSMLMVSPRELIAERVRDYVKMQDMFLYHMSVYALTPRKCRKLTNTYVMRHVDGIQYACVRSSVIMPSDLCPPFTIKTMQTALGLNHHPLSDYKKRIIDYYNEFFSSTVSVDDYPSVVGVPFDCDGNHCDYKCTPFNCAIFFQVLRFITLGNYMEDDPLVCRFIMDLNRTSEVSARLLKHYGWQILKCECLNDDCYCYKRIGVSRFGELIKVGESLPNRKFNVNFGCKYSRYFVESCDRSAFESCMIDDGSSFRRVSSTGHAEVKDGVFKFTEFGTK